MIKQFKRDEKQNSNKLHLDQYYTSRELSKYCISKTYKIIGDSNISDVIDPSAGDGAFSDYLDCIAYDVEPKKDYIIQQDYLTLDLEYRKNRLVISNPPYGSRLNLAKAFCNKSFEIADYVAFILPISQLNNIQSIYKFDLIHSEDLGVKEYSGVEVHCCFNIYKRPENGEYNKLKRWKDSEIVEIREVVVNSNPKRNRELGDFQYDIGICAWGNGIGKQCEIGDYAKSFFIKIKDKDNFNYYKNLILNANWKELYPMTNTPNLLQWQVYKYIDENKIKKSEDESDN